MTAGVWLLDLMTGICATLFVLGCLFGGVFYFNSASRAQLYDGVAYHATTFRVTFVQYAWVGAENGHTEARATGMIEGRKEAMDLTPFLRRAPANQYDLMTMVPEGTLIPVYLFPSLQGYSRIQPINGVPTEEWYRRSATWALHRALPVVGLIGIIGTLLGLARFSLARNRRAAF